MPDLIVKVGGGLLAAPGDLDHVMAAIFALARSCRLMIVPGGGPFADAVRAVDRQVRIPDDAAHWMAVLAMDQYAHLLAARLEGAAIVSGLAQAREALEAGRVPVLAPSEWLRQDDPLPHSWDVTSDSIAAWVAGASGAREIVLVKPRGATGDMVDSHFARVGPRHVRTTIVPVEQVDAAFSQIAAGRVAPDLETT
jgi:aspartokinase-like uncharacterized kinase